MSGRKTHATRIPFHPELVSLRVLLQSPSARHNVRCSPFRVDRLLEPRSQLQLFVLGPYYLAREDDRHVRGMIDRVERRVRAMRRTAVLLRFDASLTLPRHVDSDRINHRFP